MKNSVYIVGGGSSLKNFDFNILKDKETICVNKSVFDVPNPNYFITIDYLFTKKFMVCSIKCPKIFIANFAIDRLFEIDGQIVDKKKNIKYNLENFDLIIKSKKISGCGKLWNDFRNGIHSGFCALQFAYLMGYENIYLLGFDYNISNDTHYHNEYDDSQFATFYNNYYDYIKSFFHECPNKNIYICSKESKLAQGLKYRKIK